MLSDLPLFPTQEMPYTTSFLFALMLYMWATPFPPPFSLKPIWERGVPSLTQYLARRTASPRCHTSLVVPTNVLPLPKVTVGYSARVSFSGIPSSGKFSFGWPGGTSLFKDRRASAAAIPKGVFSSGATSKASRNASISPMEKPASFSFSKLSL